MIDAKEGRDVGIFDVPGAFLHPEVPDDKMILMVLRGPFVDMMCQVNLEFKKYICYDNKGRKMLYMQVLRSIYGCIEAAMLWYELYASTLKGLGFIINPYDRCVANAIIEGKQCTIMWYVDDNKISHMNPAVVTRLLGEIKNKLEIW